VFEVLNLSKEAKDIQSMVDLLKQGATLTEFACPACSSPLFRFKEGEIWCAKCEKRVIIVKEDEDAEKAESKARLMTLERTILTKIESVEKKIREEADAEELQKLNNVLASLLENLEKLKRIRQA
jgi:UPF0148 protein